MKPIDSKASGPVRRTTGPDHRTTPAGAALLHRGGPDRLAVESGQRRTGPGGQHRATIGTSTRDTPEVALFWFNAELQQYAGVADVAW